MDVRLMNRLNVSALPWTDQIQSRSGCTWLPQALLGTADDQLKND